MVKIELQGAAGALRWWGKSSNEPHILPVGLIWQYFANLSHIQCIQIIKSFYFLFFILFFIFFVKTFFMKKSLHVLLRICFKFISSVNSSSFSKIIKCLFLRITFLFNIIKSWTNMEHIFIKFRVWFNNMIINFFI